MHNSQKKIIRDLHSNSRELHDSRREKAQFSLAQLYRQISHFCSQGFVIREQILVNKSEKSDHPHQREPWSFVEVVNKSEYERKTSSPQHSRCSYASGELIRINFHPKTAEKMAPHCMARLDLVNCIAKANNGRLQMHQNWTKLPKTANNGFNGSLWRIVKSLAPPNRI